MEIGWIREGLKKPGKSQRGLARALGRDPAAVHRLLAGERRLYADEVSKIAAYLEVDPPAAVKKSHGTAGKGNYLPAVPDFGTNEADAGPQHHEGGGEVSDLRDHLLRLYKKLDQLEERVSTLEGEHFSPSRGGRGRYRKER